MKLGKSDRVVLGAAAHSARFGWHIGTSRRIRKRYVESLMGRGLLEDAGLAVVVDGDGFALQPERYKASYRLTALGLEAVTQIRKEQDAEIAKWNAEWEASQKTDAA